MQYIKSQISEEVAKKIFANQTNAITYLQELAKVKHVPTDGFRVVGSGAKSGQTVWRGSGTELWRLVVETWQYDQSLPIIRQMFKHTKKYQIGQTADQPLQQLRDEWSALQLGEVKWPFSQGAFDEFVQAVNSESLAGDVKDDKVRLEAVRYRRIKEINTYRNDFIETLIFEKNQIILPTLDHNRGVDFFIDGVSYDQKVAKSPTGKFKDKYKDNWRQTAIDHPELVAEYLYMYQDEGRFGADPRLLVVYLDEDVTTDQIRQTINGIDLTTPLEINFTYQHKSTGPQTYKVPCFVILLHT